MIAERRPWPRLFTATLAPVTAAMVIASLAGCSSTPPAAEAPTPAVSSAGAPSPGTTATPAPQSPPAASTSPSPAPSGPPGLIVTPNKRTDLSKYGSFTYDTAQATGIAEAAAVAVNATLDRIITTAVDDAAAQQETSDCLPGEKRCGLFELTVAPKACGDYLCALITIARVGVGAAISDGEVVPLVFDSQTGQAIDLTDAFGTSLDARIAQAALAWQDEQGYSRNDVLTVGRKDIEGWMPDGPDTITVWFPKYTIGSGADGIVELTIPTGTDDQTERSLAPDFNAAVDWLCNTLDVRDLPRLEAGAGDTYAVSALQHLLVYLDYPPGGMPVDGEFGPTTTKAVKGYQQDSGLVVDGLVGPQTWQSLQDRCEDDGDPGGDSGTTTTPQQPAPQPVPQPQQPQQPQPVTPTLQAPQFGMVPDVVGLPASTAQSILQAAGFRMSPGAPMGSSAYIKSQAPPGGSRMALGTSVSVFFGY